MACDREICAITTYCEASNASPEERRCIVHSMFNRKADGRFGKTIAAVCLKRFQFSEFNDDQGDNANLMRAANAPDNDPVFLDCLEAFDEVADGSPDPSGGATHYHDKSIKPPYWATGATVSA
jgi:N-acetylmuramoyl-L-alanine amidase